ncbi:phosphatidylinositol mannoside acyltransferase [Mangrovactinospora gilvigrisea]|uniref:Phosphatidylinositol mannoside acyltransferase n=1 Tax=Mangrovactinospora gilvigrisea TaxID=1428644 RepID=A0A1J7CC64_9ACTN|nr:phosphatidylinositol mannoside acyltransferase [Mangrovactinospora gilvigrisea]OIV39112.1 phosphatidylinositol mannoside acyltransferase [Mangrovactinospora gilvigrisea]
MSAARPDTAALRLRAADAAYGAGWSLVRKMPAPAARRLGRTLADAAWQRRGRGVLQLERNLARVCPGLGPERMRTLSRAGMRSYMRYWVESFRLPALTAGDVNRIVRAPQVHHIDDAMKAGLGCILALPHMGNWDLAGAYIAYRGYPFTTVMERLRPETLYDRFVAYRSGLGMEVLPLDGGARETFGVLARRLRAGGLVCLVADRDLSESGVRVDFFGETARMPAGPAALALLTGAALVPVTLDYEGPVRMRANVHAPLPHPAHGNRAERTAQLTQSLADVFQNEIAAHPQDWHMLQRLWLADLADRRPDGAP